MSKSDFSHLRVTPAQSRELHAVLNAEVVASWDAPMRKAQAADRGETMQPKAEPGGGWDRAMGSVRGHR